MAHAAVHIGCANSHLAYLSPLLYFPWKNARAQDIQFQQLDWMMDLLKDISAFERFSQELLELVVSHIPGLLPFATAERQVHVC